jgi:pimeloyl-ACP methyl ester carboxylesterase
METETEVLMPIDNWKEFFSLETFVAAFKRRKGVRRIEKIAEMAPLQRAKVGDIDVAFRELGRGEPLFMITAYSVSMDMWDARLLRHLASRYRVIIFDNRGMGKTTAGTAPWSIGRFAADTAGFIRQSGYERANVLGWSLGGDIALGLAVAYPRMVERLIIYAGDCGGPHKIAAPKYHEVLKRVFRYGYVPFGEFLSILFPPSWMKAHPDYWRSVPLIRQRFHPWRIARQNRAYEEWPGVYEELPAIEAPVLVITGTEDVSTPPENADILVERIPGARLVRFRGAGHGLMYQYPDELSQSIFEFLPAS